MSKSKEYFTKNGERKQLGKFLIAVFDTPKASTTYGNLTKTN